MSKQTSLQSTLDNSKKQLPLQNWHLSRGKFYNSRSMSVLETRWKRPHVVTKGRPGPSRVEKTLLLSRRLWPHVWMRVRNQCTGAGEVNGLLDIPLPSKVPKSGAEKRVWPSLKTEVWRGGGRETAAPARDRFLSRSRGFYTWFNMLQGEFGPILHSGLPRHSHFKSNCWPGRTTWENPRRYEYCPGFFIPGFFSGQE